MHANDMRLPHGNSSSKRSNSLFLIPSTRGSFGGLFRNGLLIWPPVLHKFIDSETRRLVET